MGRCRIEQNTHTHKIKTHSIYCVHLFRSCKSLYRSIANEADLNILYVSCWDREPEMVESCCVGLRDARLRLLPSSAIATMKTDSNL